MPNPTLHRTHHKLSDPRQQIEILENGPFADGRLPRFEALLEKNGKTLEAVDVEILQVNLGYQCNQTCTHCHVDAGPDRKEIMTKETMSEIIDVLKENMIKTLDITGGAPEMNPNFRWFVEQARPWVKEVIVRSNLTIFSANKKYHVLSDFFAKHRIRVITSLPCYTLENTDRQRGNGVFNRSIDALKQLNRVGYGSPETGLKLDLVYNPQGLGLPGPQAALERDYKRVLKEEFDIVFDELFCITNLPISRFLDSLIRDSNYEEYMRKLVEAFNPDAVAGVMCTNTLSVGWDGRLFDCDFNQMLELPTDRKTAQHIRDFDFTILSKRKINVNQHCFGCTAGAGSSCQGSLV